MRRLLPLLPLVLGSVVLAGADAPAPTGPAGPARLHRNVPLVQACVQTAVKLAAEDDALKRAEHCNVLAQRLAREIETAAEKRESDRAAELGEHLRDLLRQGVAETLWSVRGRTPGGSTREADMRRVSDQVANLVRPLERVLGSGRTDEADLQPVLRELREARDQVQRALKGTARGRGTPAAGTARAET